MHLHAQELLPFLPSGVTVTGAALLENNEAATKLTTANGGTFT